MERVIDQAIRECASKYPTSSVCETLKAVFGSNQADMMIFFVNLFAQPPPDPSAPNKRGSSGAVPPQEHRCLTIHCHQKTFRSVFLKHARLLGLEEDPEAHEEEDAPANKTTDFARSVPNASNRGRKKRNRQQPSALSGSTAVTAPADPPSSSSLPVPPPPAPQRGDDTMELRNAKSFHVKFLLKSGAVVIHRQYHTLVSIRLMCAVLLDRGWHDTCASLSDIPHLLVWLLLKFHNNPAPRNFVVQKLLTEQARSDVFVQYQIQNPNELFSQRLEMIFAEKAADKLSGAKHLREKLQETAALADQDSSAKADEILKGTGPLDPDLLTLTAYMYFRYRMSDLQAAPSQIKAMFALMMCIFEELARSARRKSADDTAEEGNLFEHRIETALNVMSTQTRASAAGDIKASSALYRRTLEVSSELHLFMKRRALGSEIVTHGGNIQELDRQMTLRVSLIQKLYCSMGRIERRLRELRLLETMNESYELMSDRKMFHWVKAMQVPWKGMVQDLSRRLFSYQAQCLIAFAGAYRECVTFAVEQKVHAHQVLGSVRYLNRKYPSFRMLVMGFRSSPGTPNRPVVMDVDNTEDLLRPDGEMDDELPTVKPLLSRSDAMAVIHDGTMCMVLFSSPKAHQRMCSYEILETLTTFGHEKTIPFYTHLLRLYSAVFERVPEEGSSPGGTPRAKDPEDDQENLWIVAQVLVYQICRYTPNRYKRMIQSASRCVLHRGHILFDVYRWMHWICEKLAAYMGKYPFFRVYGDQEARASYREQHQALANTCDILLCFLCLKTTHIVPGETLERLRIYLEKLKSCGQDKFAPHKDLFIYLCHLKKTLSAIDAAPQISLEETRYVALQFYVADLLEDKIHEQSQLFKELLFDRAYQHRDKERRVWINVLFYKFCVDREMDLQLCGDLLFKMSYEIEKVDRRIYWRQIRAEGKDADAVSAGARTPKTPGTPRGSDALGSPRTHSSSRPTTPARASPARPKPEPEPEPVYAKIVSKKRRYNNCRDLWAPFGDVTVQSSLVENPEPQNGLPEDFSEGHRPAARYLILRQIDRESKAGFGWMTRNRSDWKNALHPFSENSKRFVYFGLSKIISDTQIYMATAEYTHFFCWPRIKPKPDDERYISPDRIKCVEPPGPVYYLRGDDLTEARQKETSSALGSWRYIRVGIQPEDKFEPMAFLLRELEWMLYYRSYTTAAKHYRVLNSSPCPWHLRAEDFVMKQLNSRLPVDYKAYKSSTENPDHATGEFLCLEDSLWIIHNESSPSPSSSLSAAPTPSGHDRQSSPSLSPQSGGSASGPSAFPSPSDSELRYLCKEHSKTFSGGLADIGDKAESTDELPLVKFIRENLLPEKEPDQQVEIEMEELIEEGLVLSRPRSPPPPAKRPADAGRAFKKLEGPPAPASLYSNSKRRPLPPSPSPRPDSPPRKLFEFNGGIDSNDMETFGINPYGTIDWVKEMSGFYTTSAAAAGGQEISKDDFDCDVPPPQETTDSAQQVKRPRSGSDSARY
jgi:hypothetical protein